MFPEGFMMLNTTGTVRQLVDDDFEKQLHRIEEAAQDLVENNCDSIIFSGSPLFTRLPFGADRELGQKAKRTNSACPVAAGLTAEVEALKAMNCRKLVVGTPYHDELNQRLEAPPRSSPVSKSCRSPATACAETPSSRDLPVHASYKIAKRLYAKGRDADGIFIACPRWPTITDVQLLEDEIGKPVVTEQLGVQLVRHETDRH